MSSPAVFRGASLLLRAEKEGSWMAEAKARAAWSATRGRPCSSTGRSGPSIGCGEAVGVSHRRRQRCPWLGALPAVACRAAREREARSRIPLGHQYQAGTAGVKHQGHASSLPPHVADAQGIPSNNELIWRAKWKKKSHISQCRGADAG